MIDTKMIREDEANNRHFVKLLKDGDKYPIFLENLFLTYLVLLKHQLA